MPIATPSESTSRQLLLKALAAYPQAWTPFMIYGLGHAVLGLGVPLAAQLLVSNLAFAGLGSGLLSLGALIGAGLAFFQIFRLGQLYLLEYAERRFITQHLPRLWDARGSDRAYFFELALIPKVFGKWALEGFEIVLTLVVGSVALTVYHPLYLSIVAAVWASLWAVLLLGSRGLETALEESTRKYETWERYAAGERPEAREWLFGRERHFQVLRRQIVLLMVSQVVGALALLLGGAWLFSQGELSLGQFVASELIGGGVFLSLGKLAKFMETHYSLLTSLVKLEHAQARRG